MSPLTSPRLLRLMRFGLNSPNIRRLANFYELACGARRQEHARVEETRLTGWSGVTGGAERIVLTLGEACLELWEFDQTGRPYPEALSPYDTRFQHIAIVVTHMQSAMERLQQVQGWSAISIDGPRTLPQSSGGVTAFKFRDLDGHPVEFLQFEAGNIPDYWQSRAGRGVCSGIDHSALSVADVARSMHFYESIGLERTTRTRNEGSEQAHLDGVPSPTVDVIGVAPSIPTPHVELLHYHVRTRPPSERLAANDIAATRLIFSALRALNAGGDRLMQDPDGHFMQVLLE